MKKLVFVFAVAFSASLFSCNNSNATAEATDTVDSVEATLDTVAATDSVDTVVVAEEVVDAVVAE